ncbi:MAG TPA: hypothetical protein VIY09_00970 [Rhizomicrobium sp.]
MAQLIIRNIEEGVKERLRRRAKARGRSMEAEARDILRSATMAEPRPRVGAGTQMAALFKDLGIDFEIPEMKGEEAGPAKFSK